MSTNLNVSIELYINEDTEIEDLQDIISEAIVENESSFIERMARVCIQYDMRADFCEGTLEIEDIGLDVLNESQGIEKVQGSGYVNVHYDWFAHYPCKDMSGGDEAQDKWDFTISEGKLEFSIELPQERYDEI